MKQYDRELEYSFSVSAAQAAKLFRDGTLTPVATERITQTWLEQGEVVGYKIRRRIRKIEALTYDKVIYEYTTKYSKNDEKAATQDNMELNAEITPEEYEKLKKIYEVAGKEEVVKIRTYFRTPLNTLSIYTLDTYPNEEGDRARIEIEFKSKEEMSRWKAPDWFKELINEK